MTTAEVSSSSSSARNHFDELRWVIHVKKTLETMIEEAYSRGPVSIFSVPKTLLSAKPEAYIPQLIALGPYHHWEPQLYQMEHYKLATAKRMLNHLQPHSFTLQQVIDHLAKEEHAIRSCYHRHLDLQAETLGCMMVIDASFLLEFLCNFSDARAPPRSHMELGGIRLACNSILRDVVMLENQVPLFLVQELLSFQYSSREVAGDELSKMLLGFLKAVYPFKATQSVTRIAKVEHYKHLLQLLYCTIVAKAKEMCNNNNNSSSNNETEISQIDVPESCDEHDKGDTEYSKKLFNSVWSLATGLHIMLIVKPIEFLLRVPWPIVTAFFGGGKRSYNPILNAPVQADEIEIPSVAELVKAGVKFSATEGDLSMLEFDMKTATFYLPAIALDANTEVVLRNLVAYETSAESGPLVFTRYTELMNGIIDTREDVGLLRQTGVIVHGRMKNDEEVARLWNGMSRSLRMTKVDFLDKVISDVNCYYKSRWSVKIRRFIKNYVSGSWQILTFLAAILLLLLTCVDAFCSVFLCSSLWSSFV